MHTTHDASPTAEVFLATLAQSAAARQSRAGAFVYIHAQVILSCLHAGYGAAQIYQGLEDLGFHPPMSARQFRRYVRRIRVAAGLEESPPNALHRLPPLASAPHSGPKTGTSKATLVPTSASTQSTASSIPPSKPSTFAWDPTADIETLR